MENTKHTVKKKFFAAANSYNGFISFFDKVFNSKDFARIYVLKGGPGTGKSSFMKKASEYFGVKNYKIEEIYCSSDPNSLDGVIIKKGEKSVAFLDGTAPHERDAIIPGAIDEIINLGDGWDDRFLIAKRDEILSVTEEKSKSYKTAYEYLKTAGRADKFIYNIYKQGFNKSELKNKAEKLFDKIDEKSKGETITRLLSSFGKYGSYKLDTLESLDTKLIFVGGFESLQTLLLDCCYELLKEKKANIIHLLCPLDPSHTDAIYLPDHRLAIVRGEGDINADNYSSLSPIDLERIRMASKIKNDALEEAKRWFAIASDLHFRLEEIYGNAMDFDKNNRLFETKIREIEIILEKV
ncbi:MAG: hypothetical protein IJX58_01985 [Clostridia bacterium]|nr:hypothetical protein [Clostridia bacterium]